MLNPCKTIKKQKTKQKTNKQQQQNLKVQITRLYKDKESSNF